MLSSINAWKPWLANEQPRQGTPISTAGIACRAEEFLQTEPQILLNLFEPRQKLHTPGIAGDQTGTHRTGKLTHAARRAA
jgi:hypothetical protein